MSDDVDPLPQPQRRVHGFAEGDRVAVVDGNYKGAYGHLILVGGAWCANASESAPHCRTGCWIFCMEILGAPKGNVSASVAIGGRNWFTAAQLTHID